MKKPGVFLLALSLIVILFGCNHPRESKPETSEIIRIADGAIHVLTETSKVLIDSSVLSSAGGKKSEIIWAYQNPGKKIGLENTVSVHYSAKSFWTESTITKKITLISYDKVQGKIISTAVSKQKVLTNWIPMAMFLILFIGLVISVLGKDPKGNTLGLFFIVCNFVISINLFLPTYDSNLEVILVSAAGTILFLFVLMIMSLAFERLQNDRIPMPYKQKKIGSLVITYAFACALSFVRFADLSGVLYYVFLIFLTPHLIFWMALILKSIFKKLSAKTI